LEGVKCAGNKKKGTQSVGGGKGQALGGEKTKKGKPIEGKNRRAGRRQQERTLLEKTVNVCAGGRNKKCEALKGGVKEETITVEMGETGANHPSLKSKRKQREGTRFKHHQKKS